jgi:hypothetical protein
MPNSSRTSRDLPTPGSPVMVTSCTDCSRTARPNALRSAASSSVRPTNGVDGTEKSSAATRARVPVACQIASGSALPLTVTGARLW